MDVMLALVEWEDITGHIRQQVPNCEEELERHMLIKHTTGYIKQFEKHLLVITDFDVTHRGRDYMNSDFTIIPNGAVRAITYLKPTNNVEVNLAPTYTDEETRFE